jgi:hypothetical protein
MPIGRSRGILTLGGSGRGDLVEDRPESIRPQPCLVGHRLPGCSRVLLLLLFLLPGCMRAGGDAAASGLPLYAGVWPGDVAPSAGAPFGALFHVDESAAGLTIRLESQFARQTFTDIEAARDSLRFTWPLETPRHCLLQRRADHGWEGTCQSDGTDPIALLLLPPDRRDVPTGLARAAVESDISWMEKRVGRLRILVQAGGVAEGHAPALRESAVAAFDSAFELLEETPPDVPFWILYIDSRAEMRQLAGWPAGGWADGVARTAANTVTEGGRSPDRHEVMHIAATVAWGIPAAPWEWINEGLATYAPGGCAGAGIHPLASALVESGSAEPLNRLIHEFRQLDEVTAYLQSASVVGYIREVFGIEAVRSIWQDGPAALPLVTGMEPDDLERAWRAFVSRAPAASRALEAVHTQGCL